MLEPKPITEEFSARVAIGDLQFPALVERVVRHLACENRCDMATFRVVEDDAGLLFSATRTCERCVPASAPGQWIDKDPGKDVRAQQRLERAERREAQRAERRAQG